MAETRTLRPGLQVIAHGRRYQISAVIDLETVLALDMECQTRHVLRIQELERLASGETGLDQADQQAPDLSAIPDDAWRIAQVRFAVIQPLLQSCPSRKPEAVEMVDI